VNRLRRQAVDPVDPLAPPARGRRRALRAAVLGTPVLVALAWPTMASAATLDDLPGHTAKFSVIDGILIFGVAPVGVFLLIALIVMRPGTAPKAQRYRPGRDWNAEPSWSGLRPAGTSASDLPALPAGERAMPVMQGAPDPAHGDSTTEAGGSGVIPGTPDTEARGGQPPAGSGGARGSW
jgi:hypothetical protein